jgi:hypothetical protein
MNTPLETLRREVEGQEDKRAYLTLMRDHMRGLLASGAPYVTANDAREFYETLPHPSFNMNFFGALFKEKGWVSTGRSIMSCGEGHHAHRILCWRWEPERIDR